MRTLYFLVEGQKLRKNGDFSGIVKGSKGYLQCIVNTDTTWDGSRTFAVFTNDKNVESAVEVIGNRCQVPDDITDESCFCVSFVGVKRNQKIVTNKVLIEQEG